MFPTPSKDTQRTQMVLCRQTVPPTRCATTTVHRALPPSKFKLAFASGASVERMRNTDRSRSLSVGLCGNREPRTTGRHGLVGVTNAVAAKAHQARSHEHSCAYPWQFGCADLVFGGRAAVNEIFQQNRAAKSGRILIASLINSGSVSDLKIPLILISLANGCVLLRTDFILKAK
jgi:hypothetical protein